MKKFNYEFDSIKLIPTKYFFLTKKRKQNYFNYLEDVEKIPYLTYKEKLLEYFEEKLNVIYTWKYISLILAFIILLAPIFIIKPYIFLGISLILFILSFILQKKFEQIVRIRNFSEELLDINGMDLLEELRKKEEI
jgi:hypothetical protein